MRVQLVHVYVYACTYFICTREYFIMHCSVHINIYTNKWVCVCMCISDAFTMIPHRTAKAGKQSTVITPNVSVTLKCVFHKRSYKLIP